VRTGGQATGHVGESRTPAKLVAAQAIVEALAHAAHGEDVVRQPDPAVKAQPPRISAASTAGTASSRKASISAGLPSGPTLSLAWGVTVARNIRGKVSPPERAGDGKTASMP